MCTPIAAAFSGVHLAQPLLAICAVRRLPPSSSAAPLRPTTPISEPPNHAARPTSCKARTTVLRSDTGALLESKTVGSTAEFTEEAPNKHRSADRRPARPQQRGGVARAGRFGASFDAVTGRLNGVGHVIDVVTARVRRGEHVGQLLIRRGVVAFDGVDDLLHQPLYRPLASIGQLVDPCLRLHPVALELGKIVRPCARPQLISHAESSISHLGHRFHVRARAVAEPWVWLCRPYRIRGQIGYLRSCAPGRATAATPSSDERQRHRWIMRSSPAATRQFKRCVEFGRVQTRLAATEPARIAAWSPPR